MTDLKQSAVVTAANASDHSGAPLNRFPRPGRCIADKRFQQQCVIRATMKRSVGGLHV